jgi:hypothetical protein
LDAPASILLAAEPDDFREQLASQAKLARTAVRRQVDVGRAAIANPDDPDFSGAQL